MKKLTIKCEGFLTPSEPESAAKMFFATDFKYALSTGKPFICKIKEICELNEVELNEDTLFNWFWFRNDQSTDLVLFGVKEGNSVIFLQEYHDTSLLKYSKTKRKGMLFS